MTHYHLITAVNLDQATASVVYDNYEDSVEAWVKLCTTLFTSVKEDGTLSIEHAKAATENGKGFMAVSGTKALCVYWMRCEDSCYSITWN